MNEFTLYTLTYLLSETLGSYAICKFIKAFFEISKVKMAVEIIVCIGYYILNVMIYLFLNIPAINFVANITAFFALTCMYDSSIKKKILVTLISYILLVCIEMIVVTLTGYINFPIIERNNYNSVFGIVVLNILKYAIAVAISGFKNIKIGNKLPEAYWISIFVIPISSLFILEITFQAEGLAAYQTAISVTAVLIINFTVFFLFDRLARLYQEKQEKVLIEQENKYYENQLQIINETQETTNILKHDMKNHLCAIFSDIKNGNMDEAQKHITDIVDVYETGTEIIHTGYPAIDSLINYRFQTAKQNGIKVNVNISLPPDLNLSSFDLTVILGNLVDKALQAVSQVNDNGFIDFTIHYTKGMILIKVSNPFKTAIKTENGRMVTSKADKENHGYGLRSVSETIDKYNGAIEIETEKNIFTVTAILYVE